MPYLIVPGIGTLPWQVAGPSWGQVPQILWMNVAEHGGPARQPSNLFRFGPSGDRVTGAYGPTMIRRRTGGSHPAVYAIRLALGVGRAAAGFLRGRSLGRRVRYVIGAAAAQVNGMRWSSAPRGVRDI
jgi:hypothetical protein